jgi:hypothetical protein
MEVSNQRQPKQRIVHPQEWNYKPALDTKYRGGILIRSLWEKGSGRIIDVRAIDTDEKYVCIRDPHKFIEEAEWLKKKNTFNLAWISGVNSLLFCFSQWTSG